MGYIELRVQVLNTYPSPRRDPCAVSVATEFRQPPCSRRDAHAARLDVRKGASHTQALVTLQVPVNYHPSSNLGCAFHHSRPREVFSDCAGRAELPAGSRELTQLSCPRQLIRCSLRGSRSFGRIR